MLLLLTSQTRLNYHVVPFVRNRTLRVQAKTRGKEVIAFYMPHNLEYNTHWLQSFFFEARIAANVNRMGSHVLGFTVAVFYHQ